MIIIDFDTTEEVENIHQLELSLMKKRRDNMNAFYLSHGNEDYPLLLILVKDDMAVLHYERYDTDIGYRSVGNVPDLIPSEYTSFALSIYDCDDIDEPNHTIVSFETALTVAKEFFGSKSLPTSIQWSPMWNLVERE